jgi:hypothetical protein
MCRRRPSWLETLCAKAIASRSSSGQLVAAQLHELLPERLQSVHLLLALRLARAIAVRQVLFVRRVVVDHRCL